MLRDRHSLFLAALMLASAGALLSMGAAKADVRLLDRIQTEVRGGRVRLQIHFAAPLQYVTHAPSSRGDELQVQCGWRHLRRG